MAIDTSDIERILFDIPKIKSIGHVVSFFGYKNIRNNKNVFKIKVLIHFSSRLKYCMTTPLRYLMKMLASN